jgi:hypothetical protein
MNTKEILVKNIVSGYLLILIIWQGFLAWSASQFISLFEAFGKEGLITNILSYSQPLIVVFMLLTLVIAYEIYSRKIVLVSNTLVTAISFTVATIIIQLHVSASSYIPLFEMGGAN